MKRTLWIFGWLSAASLCAPIKVDAAYSWIDSEGTTHFSDNPPVVTKGQKVKTKLLNMENQQNIDEISPPRTDTKAGKSTSDILPSIGHYDSNIESELRRVWHAFGDAVARKDVNSAANFIASENRNECREGFKAAGSRLVEMKEYVTEIELVYVKDGWAKCRTYREEKVKGTKTLLAFVVYFIKEKGQWKINKC